MKKNNHLKESLEERKRKKQEKNMLKIIVLSVILLGVLLIALNFRAIIAPFEGIGQKINRSGTNAGFPVKIPANAGYSIEPFDNGFMLLSETYVYTYGEDGGFNYAHQHGYSAPKIAVGDKRILVFDDNGRKFSFLGRNGQLYEKESEERIVYGAVGRNNEKVAIVFRSAIHSNILEIYDDKGDWKYRRRFTDENIMQLVFTASDNDVIVTTIGFDSWIQTATVRRLDTLSENESVKWEVPLPDNTLPFAIHVRGNNVFVLCEDSLTVIDLSVGNVIGSYVFNGVLADFAFSESDSEVACVILTGDYTSGTMNMISLNRKAELNQVIPVPTTATQVEIGDKAGNIAVLEPNAIALYSFDKTASEEPEILELNEEYSKFIYMGEQILLLGYDSVVKAKDEATESEYNQPESEND
ncbi:MAG: DUF5711 family protein [Oscillospiraceae bacterium]|nr:DUF5711 family protein [Oscillospiraceae bacterium]